MKQRIFLAIVAIAISVAFSPAPGHAQGQAQVQTQGLQPISINASNVQELIVHENMEVLLMQANTNERTFVVDKEASDIVNVSLTYRTMEISMKNLPRKKLQSKNERQVVVVYVNDLKSLSVSGNSVVRTRGALITPELNIYVDDSAIAHLITTGEVYAFPMGDGSVEVKHINKEFNKKGF